MSISLFLSYLEMLDIAFLFLDEHFWAYMLFKELCLLIGLTLN